MKVWLTCKSKIALWSRGLFLLLHQYTNFVKPSLAVVIWQISQSGATSHIGRAQKQRASRTEDALEQIKVQLLERENQLADLEASTAQIRARCEKHNKEKTQLLSENTKLQLWVFDWLTDWCYENLNINFSIKQKH